MNKIKYAFILFFSIGSMTVFSQTSTNSPYSRFGLGDLSGSISAEQAAIGGYSVVYANENSINSNNPATYSMLQPKSLLLSTAIIHQSSQLSTHNLMQNTNNTNFSHISIAMPINKNLFVSSGLLPYSNIGYMIEDSEDYILETTDTTTIDYSYIGNGGISNYYLGTSIKLHKTLSVGINASYLFGGLNRNKTVDFNHESIFNVSAVNRTNISGISLKTGFLFNTQIGEDRYFSIAATYEDNSHLNTRRTLLGTTYEINNSSLFVKDTFENIIDSGSLVLPSKISAGITYSSEKWLLIANYFAQNWQDYEIQYNDEVQIDSLQNSMCVSAGAQYIPDYNSVTKYWQRINYRIGARYNKSYLQIRNNQLIEKSLTFGLGLPVKKSNTFYNVSIELGQRGTTEDNLIKEQFIRFYLGVTFKGIWFVKRKYD